MLDWMSGESEDEGGEGEGLKSQRPKRRKQAVQVARPMTWLASACQPRRARARAEVLRGDGGVVLAVAVVVVVVSLAGGFGGLGGVVEGGSEDGGWRRGDRSCEIEERSKSGGVEGSGGSSEAMATREW